MNPTHVGTFVNAEIIYPRKLTLTEIERLLQKNRTFLLNFLSGYGNLDQELATRIEEVFEVKADTLMRLQDLWLKSQGRVEDDFKRS